MSTTARYRIIDTVEIDAQIRAVLAQCGVDDVTATSARQGGTGTAHRVKYTLHSLPMTVSGDALLPTVHVFNSYGGECAFKIAVGFIRYVCSNGMIVGQTLFSRRIVHLQGDTCERQLAELSDGIRAAVEYIRGDFNADMEDLVSTQLTESQQLELVGSLPLSQQIKDSLVWKVVNRDLLREADRAPNLWTLWNLVNERMRYRGRSEWRQDLRNTTLLDDLQHLAADVLRERDAA